MIFFLRSKLIFFIEKDHEVLKGGKLVEISEEPIDTRNGRRILRTKKKFLF